MEPETKTSSSSHIVPSLLGLLGTLLFFSWFRSKFSTPVQDSNHSTNPQTQSSEKDKSAGQFSLLSSQVPPSNKSAENASQCRHYEMPWWKIVLDVLTLLSAAGAAGAAIYYAHVTSGMWTEMQTQTKTARDQLEQSQRPWIQILDVKATGDSPIVGGLSFQKIGPYKNAPDVRVQVTIQIKLSFSNIGRSVADVTPNFELFMPQFSSSEYWNRVSAEERRFCGSPDMSAVTGQKVVVFPNEPQPFQWYAGASTPIRPENINHIPDGSGISPALIVCVNYRHKGLPGLYQTRAVYEISHLDTHSRFFDIGECNLNPFRNSPITFCKGAVPAKLLKFDRDNMGDDAY